MTPDLFATHKANLIVILDVNYHPIFAKAVDLETLQPVPLPPGLSAYLQPDSPLLQHTIKQPEISGVILLDGKPMCVASLAALHTDFQANRKVP